jgi:hypothetical protein
MKEGDSLELETKWRPSIEKKPATVRQSDSTSLGTRLNLGLLGVSSQVYFQIRNVFLEGGIVARGGGKIFIANG